MPNPRPLPYRSIKLFPFEVKSVDMTSRTVEGFVNVPTTDRANEVVDPGAFLRAWEGDWPESVRGGRDDGWGGVAGPPAPYKLNPIYTYNHDFWAPVGTVLEVALLEGKPWYKAQVGGANLGSVDPDQLLQAIAEGTIRTSSFGYNELAVQESVTPGAPRVIHEFEQLDTAAVSIPCNAYATVEMAKSLGLSLLPAYQPAAAPFADWSECALAMCGLFAGKFVGPVDQLFRYVHIARQYAEFGKQTPEFLGVPMEEALRNGAVPAFGAITWNAEENVLFAESGFDDDVRDLKARADGAVRIAPFLAKVGRPLTATNRETIEQSIATLRALLEAADAGTSNGAEEPSSDGQTGKQELEAALACLEPGVAATLKTTIRRNQALRGVLHG